MPVTLYGLSRSVYTRIARLALEEKGVAYTLEEVEIFGPAGVPPAHLARHPFGRIPAFEHDGLALFETGAITRYIDEAFDGPPLQPTDAAGRARMNQLIGALDSYAYRPMVWGVFVQRLLLPREGQVTDEGEVSRSLAAAEPTVRLLDQCVEANPFIAGGGLTLADLHALPMLRCFSLAPEGLAMIRAHANVQRWFDGMLRRESVIATASRYEPPDR